MEREKGKKKEKRKKVREPCLDNRKREKGRENKTRAYEGQFQVELPFVLELP